MEDLKSFKRLEGEIGWDITIADISDKNILNTYGGDLTGGFAGYDLLKSIPNSEVGVMGVCASSGTIILLGASKRWGSKNSQFSIHNPWTYASGDAEALQKTAEELKQAQDKLVGIYVNELLIDEEEIRALMKEDKFIDASEALRIGLIREIKEDDFKALKGESAKAMFFNLKKTQMSTVTKKELSEELEKSNNSIFEKIKNLFPGRVKNIMTKDVEGVELTFDVDTLEEVTEGTGVMVDGSPASGSYVLGDGRTIVAENGNVASITPAADEGNEEMEALKAEIEKLKADLDAANAAKNDSEQKVLNLTKGLAEVKAEQEKFKNTWSKKVNNLAIPEGGDEDPGSKKIRSAYKKKE